METQNFIPPASPLNAAFLVNGFEGEIQALDKAIEILKDQEKNRLLTEKEICSSQIKIVNRAVNNCKFDKKIELLERKKELTLQYNFVDKALYNPETEETKILEYKRLQLEEKAKFYKEFFPFEIFDVFYEKYNLN